MSQSVWASPGGRPFSKCRRTSQCCSTDCVPAPPSTPDASGSYAGVRSGAGPGGPRHPCPESPRRSAQRRGRDHRVVRRAVRRRRVDDRRPIPDPFAETCGPDTFATVQAIYSACMAPRVRRSSRGSPGSCTTFGRSIRSPRTWFAFAALAAPMPALPIPPQPPGVAGGGHRRALGGDRRPRRWCTPAPHRVAVGLTDAMIWRPSRLSPSLVRDVRAEFTDIEVVELVLDVMRNAANKMAVALAADQPHVNDGVAVYEIDADGTAHYGPRGSGDEAVPDLTFSGATSRVPMHRSAIRTRTTHVDDRSGRRDRDAERAGRPVAARGVSGRTSRGRPSL